LVPIGFKYPCFILGTAQATCAGRPREREC